MGTCRIFLAPKFDERGTAMLFRDQRLLMTEMDKFIVACKLALLFESKHLAYIHCNLSESWSKYHTKTLNRFLGYYSI